MFNITPIIFISLGLFILFVLFMRIVGAWMLRINEVINTQKEILLELKKITNKKQD